MRRFQLHSDSFREWHKEGNVCQEGVLMVLLENRFGFNISQMEPSAEQQTVVNHLERAVLLQMVVSKLGKPGKLRR